jgi:general secretion pathway protein A
VYKRFYGLKKSPFEISPDPFFFYPTPGHKEVLNTLYYGVQRHKGFSVLTGQAGTGKTLLVRCLADLLAGEDVAVAYVFNPQLSAVDFVDYILTDLRLPLPSGSKSHKLFALSDYLVGRHARGSTTVLIVDEAHLLSRELLEEIRLLTNLETPQQKLLQIILSGQPELDQIIDSPDMPQLKQRIALRCRLQRLEGAEVEAYILRRLQLASFNLHPRIIFSKPAVAAIERYSQGIPRLVNTICENALVSGYADQLPIVNARIVQEVASQFGFCAAGNAASDVAGDTASDPAEDAVSDAAGNYQPGEAEPEEVFSEQTVAQASSAAQVVNPPREGANYE